jgi:RNA polymerase sigma factor (sigma-70 family)
MAFWNKKHSDEDIIEGIRSGEAQWEVVFFKEYKSRIRGFFYKKYKSYQAEEQLFSTAYHETISAVLKNIRSGQYQKSSQLSTYIHEIFKRKCIDEFRKINKKRHETGDDISELYDISDKNIELERHLLKKEALQAAESTLKSIGKNCYEIIMKHIQGYKDAEIALLLNMSNANTVKSRRNTCMKKFKIAIELKKDNYDF